MEPGSGETGSILIQDQKEDLTPNSRRAEFFA